MGNNNSNKVDMKDWLEELCGIHNLPKGNLDSPWNGRWGMAGDLYDYVEFNWKQLKGMWMDKTKRHKIEEGMLSVDLKSIDKHFYFQYEEFLAHFKKYVDKNDLLGEDEELEVASWLEKKEQEDFAKSRAVLLKEMGGNYNNPRLLELMKKIEMSSKEKQEILNIRSNAAMPEHYYDRYGRKPNSKEMGCQEIFDEVFKSKYEQDPEEKQCQFGPLPPNQLRLKLQKGKSKPKGFGKEIKPPSHDSSQPSMSTLMTMPSADYPAPGGDSSHDTSSQSQWTYGSTASEQPE